MTQDEFNDLPEEDKNEIVDDHLDSINEVLQEEGITEKMACVTVLQSTDPDGVTGISTNLSKEDLPRFYVHHLLVVANEQPAQFVEALSALFDRVPEETQGLLVDFINTRYG